MNDSEMTCREERRRDDVRSAALYGLDYVEVSDDQKALEVFFLGKAPAKIDRTHIRITGGDPVRVMGMRVQRNPDPRLDDYLQLRLDHPGDFSTYTLRVVRLDESGRPTDETMDGFDPRYDRVTFTFKASCPSDLDCKTCAPCPPPERDTPEINYLAKDYESFRQLILDRLALTTPGWSETHVPDLGITLVEMFAYVADYLSYYQDAVATEAYLRTARQRISVRRHARLVDYEMHEGCNARAWVTIEAGADAEVDAGQIFFVAGIPQRPGPALSVLQLEEYEKLPSSNLIVFEPLVRDSSSPIQVYAAHSEIHFYAWGDCRCCLPVGTTRATLVDQWNPVADDHAGDDVVLSRTSDAPTGNTDPPGTVRVLNLQVGDILIFEEIVGPMTGNTADADPRHRQAVRLTRVTRSIDPLYHPYAENYGQPLVEIEWCSEDALTFPLCISAMMPPPDCDCRADISVARGNVVLVDCGARVEEEVGDVATLSTQERCATDCDPGDTAIVAGTFRPQLTQSPLTFAQPLPVCGCAGDFIRQDPRQAVPGAVLTGTLTAGDDVAVTEWMPRRDLLDSGQSDLHFVAEIDNDGYARLRFGDGYLGRRPDAGTTFTACYRIGNGTAGNVGAEAINTVVFRVPTDVGEITPRNPLAAEGGVDAELMDEVKQFAPTAFRNVLERAITAADYAVLAADDERRLLRRQATAGTCLLPFQHLQGARGTMRWNGSWYEALVAIDPLGSSETDAALQAEIAGWLEQYRRIGHDVEVRAAAYVALDLALSVCVKPHYLRGQVEGALLGLFSNRVLPDGTRGFFHPDNLIFGEGVYASRIIAAAQAVPGVMEVKVLCLERFDMDAPGPHPGGAPDFPTGGVLPLGPLEIARLDNDPDRPEMGRLVIEMKGGR